MSFSIFLIATLFTIIKGNIITLPLYGNVYKYGYYFIKINVGLPLSQQQTLIVDTGSSLTGFSCLDCINCGTHENKPFNINWSATSNIIKCKENHTLNNVRISVNYSSYKSFLKNKCVYDIEYSEGSRIIGYFFEDFAEFESELSPNLEIRHKFENKFVFGCNVIEDSFFKFQKASGILGLANYSNKGMNQIINYIFKRNEVREIYTEKIISIFFETDGGKLTFGSTYFDQAKISDYPLENYNITRCVNEERYCAYISKIEVDSTTRKIDKKINEDSFKAIFDTGTTISIFPAGLFNKITRGLFNKVSKYYPKISGYDEKDGFTCWKILDGISIDKFPNIKVMFKNDYNKLTEKLVINWPPESYLYLNKILDNNVKVYCLGITSNNFLNLETGASNDRKNLSNINEIILGATFFIYKEITFFLNEDKIMIRYNYLNAKERNIIPNTINSSRSKDSDSSSNKESKGYYERKSKNTNMRYIRENILYRTIAKKFIVIRNKYEILRAFISSSLIIIILFSIFAIYQKFFRKLNYLEKTV
ncbi:membrane associated aspartyl protease [Cryptosporidium sp. chipmunk genotype I]|uniref:membrane associated aspartyl protease n=1 Tax=Cryptosporidium sp. chipmunk genotype I TaxID=1280935 RepID=UPI00351A09BE|nr:membrane associated aspartyl protease [Cryptosporidium sp. chipmunk genotype I]